MAATIHPYYHSQRKRVFDVCLSGTLLLLLAPLFSFIALAILITSNGPIFFFQRRAGTAGKPFWMVKFRTMYPGAHRDQKLFMSLNQAPGPMFKVFDDPRFVGIGKWLSWSGLDELPQLWNILRGEMSIVGPRPLPIAEEKKLTSAWDFRSTVKPGIISEWALSPHRHDSLRQWRKLDTEMLATGGAWYECSLLVRTAEMLVERMSRRLLNKLRSKTS